MRRRRGGREERRLRWGQPQRWMERSPARPVTDIEWPCCSSSRARMSVSIPGRRRRTSVERPSIDAPAPLASRSAHQVGLIKVLPTPDASLLKGVGPFRRFALRLRRQRRMPIAAAALAALIGVLGLPLLLPPAPERVDTGAAGAEQAGLLEGGLPGTPTPGPPIQRPFEPATPALPFPSAGMRAADPAPLARDAGPGAAASALPRPAAESRVGEAAALAAPEPARGGPAAVTITRPAPAELDASPSPVPPPREPAGGAVGGANGWAPPSIPAEAVPGGPARPGAIDRAVVGAPTFPAPASPPPAAPAGRWPQPAAVAPEPPALASQGAPVAQPGQPVPNLAPEAQRPGVAATRSTDGLGVGEPASAGATTPLADVAPPRPPSPAPSVADVPGRTAGPRQEAPFPGPPRAEPAAAEPAAAESRVPKPARATSPRADAREPAVARGSSRAQAALRRPRRAVRRPRTEPEEGAEAERAERVSPAPESRRVRRGRTIEVAQPRAPARSARRDAGRRGEASGVEATGSVAPSDGGRIELPAALRPVTPAFGAF